MFPLHIPKQRATVSALTLREHRGAIEGAIQAKRETVITPLAPSPYLFFQKDNKISTEINGEGYLQLLKALNMN